MAASAGANSRFQVTPIWRECNRDRRFDPFFVKVSFGDCVVNSAITIPITGRCPKGRERTLQFHILKRDGTESLCDHLNFTAEQINAMVLHFGEESRKVVAPKHMVEGAEYELSLQSEIDDYVFPFIIAKEDRIQHNTLLTEALKDRLCVWMLNIESKMQKFPGTVSDYMPVIYQAVDQMDQTVLEEIKASLEEAKHDPKKYVDFCILAFNTGLLSKISLKVAELKTKQELTADQRRYIGALNYRKLIQLIGSDHLRRSQVQLLPGITLLG